MTLYGYARVSTAGQDLEGQIKTLKDKGCLPKNVYQEKFTGTTTQRPQFNLLLKTIAPGDTLIITKLDRFARNTREALEIIQSLFDQDITF